MVSMKMSVCQALNAKQSDKRDIVVRIVQDGGKGQGSVKARKIWVDRLKTTHANAPMTGLPDS
jgi:hypothetical protein